MRWLAAVMLIAVLSGAVHAQENGDAAAGRAAFMAAQYEKAKRILEPLAEAGDAEAQYWIGVMYAHGRGYPPVCRQAIRWYERAAAQGHPLATFNVGFMLYHGWGADPSGCRFTSDAARAAPWLKKAAEMNVPRAQYLIGHIYETGNGLPRSMDEAFLWIEKAANAGLSEAQFDLGLMYARAGNRKDAYTWFFLLAERGYPGARQNADVLAKNMTPGDVYEAERRALYWTPTDRAP